MKAKKFKEVLNNDIKSLNYNDFKEKSIDFVNTSSFFYKKFVF